ATVGARELEMLLTVAEREIAGSVGRRSEVEICKPVFIYITGGDIRGALHGQAGVGCDVPKGSVTHVAPECHFVSCSDEQIDIAAIIEVSGNDGSSRCFIREFCCRGLIGERSIAVV